MKKIGCGKGRAGWASDKGLLFIQQTGEYNDAKQITAGLSLLLSLPQCVCVSGSILGKIISLEE